MKSTDNIGNSNDLIIELQAQLIGDKLNKELLIREIFALWYVLVEGLNCENFTEEDIKKLLIKNYSTYKVEYVNDADYNFIIGWR